MATIKQHIHKNDDKEQRFYESVTVSKMSFYRLISHFAPFVLFLFIIALISGGMDIFNNGGKFWAVALILLGITLSIIPWLRDFLKR